VNRRNIDPLGIAVGDALKALAAARESPDLVAAYSLIGSQLADAGRQQADSSQIREIVRRCASEADISGPVDIKWLYPVSAEMMWGGIVKKVALKSIAQLHREGLKADEQDVMVAATAEIKNIRAAPETREREERAEKERKGAPPDIDWRKLMRTIHSNPPGTAGPGK